MFQFLPRITGTSNRDKFPEDIANIKFTTGKTKEGRRRRHSLFSLLFSSADYSLLGEQQSRETHHR